MGPLGRKGAGLVLPRMLAEVVYRSSHLPLIRGDAKDLPRTVEKKQFAGIKEEAVGGVIFVSDTRPANKTWEDPRSDFINKS